MNHLKIKEVTNLRLKLISKTQMFFHVLIM